MFTDTPNLQSVIARLEKLERQNRRLKQAGMLALLLLALVASMGQQQCTTERPSNPVPTVSVTQGYQRFVPPGGGVSILNWALDTKTGQLCKTWDWTSPAIDKAVASGDLGHKLTGADAAGFSTLTCNELASTSSKNNPYR